MTNESIPIASNKPRLSAAQRTASRTHILLHGPIVLTLLRLAPPNVVVNVVLIAVTASVDAHFIGRFGPDALAGISLVFPFIMLM
jgi:Na+-driven multidrug efflux pump